MLTIRIKVSLFEFEKKNHHFQKVMGGCLKFMSEVFFNFIFIVFCSNHPFVYFYQIIQYSPLIDFNSKWIK